MSSIVDLYQLGPMQQGMLFHCLQAGASQRVHFVQISYTWSGELDDAAFDEAWRQVIARHPMLRTTFLWEGLEKSLQVVRQQGQLEIVRHDLRAIPTPDQALTALLEADRCRGFQLNEAPLMRLMLCRVQEKQYRITWSFHHILFEGWSASLIHKDFLLFYEALRQGRTIQLPPPRPFRDYIIWLQQKDRTEAASYWRAALEGLTEPTPLGVDRPLAHAPADAAGSNEERVWLSTELYQNLQDYARQHRLTLNVVMQGAWALLLSRYSGQTKVLFGAVVSGRQAAPSGAESIVGLMINTLPSPVHVDFAAAPVTWLRNLQAQQLEMLTYEYCSLVEIQGWSQIRRGTPLFESLFVFENWIGDTSSHDRPLSCEIKDFDQFDGGPGFPLAIVVEPSRQQCLLKALYDTNRFERTTIQRLLGHLTCILESFVHDKATTLDECTPLTEAERFQLLVEWNDTQAEIPTGGLARLFEHQVEQRPEAVAVVCDDEHLTYEALNRRSNRIAHTLRRFGVGPEVRVGLCIERSADLPVGLLGIIKAGGAYVPLDPDYPLERLLYMMETAGLSVVVTRAAEAEKLPAYWCRCVCLDSTDDFPSLENDSNVGLQMNHSHVVYVSFTSGSTGEPKGVEVRQGGVARLIFEGGFAELNERQRILHLSPLAFDASTFEIWGALLRGGCCVLLPDGVPAPRQIAEVIRKEKITTAWLTASLFNLLIDDATVALDGLEQLLIGGEALSAHHVRQALERLPGTQLINGYGPTESTTFACCYAITRNWERSGERIPIGGPIGNTQVYVLGGRGEVAPAGVVGELFIAGEGLARGYLNSPELTAERFVPGPVGEKHGSRWYRTGDLVRQLPDGRLDFLGRSDHQVKLRGFRIELGEVEAVTLQYPGVQQVAAIVREDIPGDRRLVVYVVPEPGNDCQAIELRQFLQTALPNYMVPSACVVLDSLPLTPSGKTDRRALPVPNVAERPANLVTAGTPIEELLSVIWQQVLGREAAGVDEGFFDLGGHSLLATQAISQVRQVFGVEVSLRQFFEEPYINSLAATISQLQREENRLVRPPLKPVIRSGAAPLSFAQQRLWFIERFLSKHTLYLIPVALRLKGRLQLPAFEQSFQEVIRRHEVLRTRIEELDGQPAQVIEEQVSLPVRIVDLSGLNPDEQLRLAQQLAQSSAERSLDLTRAPLMRLQLLRLGPTNHVAVLVMHHIVTDGWSNAVLVDELAQLYHDYRAGNPSALAELPVQYADYAVWQREWLTGQVLEDQLSYWRQQLADAPRTLALPADHLRPAHPTYAGAQQVVQLDESLLRAVEKLGRREGVTLFMTLLSCLQCLFYRYSGQEDICIGTAIANRTQAEIEKLIGFFVNTLVMRSKLEPSMEFAGLLKQVREVALGAYAHQDIPFEQLVEIIEPDRQLNSTPFFQVVLAVQNTPLRTLELAELSATPVALSSRTAKFALTMDVKENSGGLSVTMEYSTELFEHATISRMLRHFEVLLKAAAETPRQCLATLPLLTGAESHSLLTEWNDTRTDYPRDESMVGLFERQVEQNPDAIALVYGDQQLTYGELNRRANQLAGHLRALGAGPEIRVGLCVERSLEMVCGMLGILKAGGVYVPLDAEYPAERIAFMLKDSAISMIVTQAKFWPRFDSTDVLLVNLDNRFSSTAAINTCDAAARAESTAYVMYTSGSTGRPKGICITQRSVVRLVRSTNYAQLNGDEVFLQFAPISFDASTLEIWGSLLNSARLVIHPAGDASLEELADVLQRYEVTTLWLTGGLFQQMVDFKLESLRSLRQLLAGGEALSVPHVRRVLEEFENIKLINGYGPTENTTFTCCFPMDHTVELGLSVPIGRPIANTQVYLLDRNLEIVPVGVPGELHAGGDGLGWGYLNLPDLTAATFIPHPHGAGPGSRLYKTGDLARYRADGRIEFIGRLDRQVKLRGFRLEPEEIAAVLKEHPAVREAVVIVREVSTGDKQLVAYVVPNRESSEHELKQYLKNRLPGYMIPSAFVMLEELPLTANGKIDRASLPLHDFDRDGSTRTAPRTMVEELLAGIWQQLLGHAEIGIDDDFFDLGGHSLIATQVASRVRQVFQLNMPLSWLFEAPTVALLAARIETLLRDERLQEVMPELSPVDRNGEIPLSFAQQGMWVLNEMLPGWTVHNVQSITRLSGKLNPAIVQQSFGEIVRRHEVLRTRFVARRGQAIQQVDPPSLPSLPLVDLSALDENERDQIRTRLMRREHHRAFNLSQGPLFRLALLRLSNLDHMLLLTMHHIVTDGWSLGILGREIAGNYRAFSQGMPAPFPELQVQYADYAIWQRHWMSGAVLESQSNYWQEQLRNLPKRLRLGRKRVHSKPSDFRCASRTINLSADLCNALRGLSRDHGVTLFMTLLAAYQTLLYRYTAQEQIPVGAPFANRNNAESENLIGFFVNMLVLSTNLEGNPSFLELLERVKKITLEAYAHQEMPFELLIKTLQPDRNLGHAPLVQATLTLHNVPSEPLKLPDLVVTSIPIEGGKVEYDLSLILTDHPAGLNGLLIYNAEIFEASSIDRMLLHFNAILEQVVDQPEVKLLDIHLPEQTETAAPAEPELANVHHQDHADKFVFKIKRA
ncbi:MAG TPA: amino acid adenylation domain-containing protein [Pyrinomonadaceae bacterium]